MRKKRSYYCVSITLTYKKAEPEAGRGICIQDSNEGALREKRKQSVTKWAKRLTL